LHSYFLRPGDTAVPIVYDVERIRDGRSFATRRIVARQHGHQIFLMTASFQIPEEGFEHQDQMPDVASPSDSRDMAEVFRASSPDNAEQWMREWAALELRYVGDSREGGVISAAERPAQSRLWIRVSGELNGDPLLHQAALTYASDLTLLGSALVRHGRHVSDPQMQSASLDHSAWFHRPFRADEWLLYDQVSPSASGGRGLAFGRLFTQEGLLVASVAQEGLIRLRDRS